MTEATARDPRSVRRTTAALIALVVMLGLPYAVLGPQFLLDDWFTLWWRQFDGFWSTPGGQLRARPGAWLVYLVEFGVIGRHPLVLYLLLLALNAAAAGLLYRVLLPVAGQWRAVAVTSVWVVAASDSSLVHWLSTMNIVLGLVLFLVGVLALQRATLAGRASVGAVVAFVTSGLCYEVTLLPSAAALVAVPWLLDRRPRTDQVVTGASALAATGLWMLVNTQHDVSGWFDAGKLAPLNFGWGITAWRPLGIVVGLVALVGIATSLYRLASPRLRRRTGWPERFVGAGLLVLVLGTAAFIRNPIEPTGLGDRANVIGSIGGALVWVGLIGAVIVRFRRRHWRVVGIVAATVWLAVALPGRLQRDLDYARAGDDGIAVLDALSARYCSPPDGMIVVGPQLRDHHGIVGLIGTIEPAWQTVKGDRRYRARIATGPADFDATPVERRFDLRTSLGAEDRCDSVDRSLRRGSRAAPAGGR